MEKLEEILVDETGKRGIVYKSDYHPDLLWIRPEDVPYTVKEDDYQFTTVTPWYNEEGFWCGRWFDDKLNAEKHKGILVEETKND